jgi:hypothetical protein
MAAVMMHQGNYQKGEKYVGFPIWCALAEDAEAPEHEEVDVIVQKDTEGGAGEDVVAIKADTEGGPEGEVIAPTAEQDGGPGPAEEGTSAKGKGKETVAGGDEGNGGAEGSVWDPSKEPITIL